MTECYECDRWFHLECAKLTRKPKPEEGWLCVKCQKISYEINRLKAFEKGDPTPNNNLGPVFQELMIGQREQSKEQLQEFLKAVNTLVGDKKEPSHIEILLRRQSLMQLPRFGGDPVEWPNFKQTFDDTNKEGKFSNLENLNRLKQALYGPAQKSVQQLMLDAANVNEIMLRLKNSYGRTDLVYLELRNNLYKIRGDSKGIVVEMVNALENLIQTVNLLNEPDCLKDHTLVMDLTAKLPHNIQEKRAKYMAEADSPLRVQRLDDLCDWLRPYAKTANMLKTISAHSQRGGVHLHEQPNQPKGSRQPIKGGKDLERKSYGTRKCLVCNQSHETRRCYALNRQPLAERLKIAQQKHLCIGCLRSNTHSVNECASARPCGINGCTMKHFRMFHVENTPRTNRSEGVNNHHENQKTSLTHYQVLPPDPSDEPTNESDLDCPLVIDEEARTSDSYLPEPEQSFNESLLIAALETNVGETSFDWLENNLLENDEFFDDQNRLIELDLTGLEEMSFDELLNYVNPE